METRLLRFSDVAFAHTHTDTHALHIGHSIRVSFYVIKSPFICDVHRTEGAVVSCHTKRYEAGQ